VAGRRCRPDPRTSAGALNSASSAGDVAQFWTPKVAWVPNSSIATGHGHCRREIDIGVRNHHDMSPATRRRTATDDPLCILRCCRRNRVDRRDR
jgi:hypothetical protein